MAKETKRLLAEKFSPDEITIRHSPLTLEEYFVNVICRSHTENGRSAVAAPTLKVPPFLQGK
jgi:hypothetical protein